MLVSMMAGESHRHIGQILKNNISFLCCGPTGVGKSTLLNGILGRDTWLNTFPVGMNLKRGNLKLTREDFIEYGVTVTVWDSPGLERSTKDEEYLKDIQEKCSDPDIFIYCIDGSESRATEVVDENSSLVKFTKVFGVTLWEHSIIVLTQANALEADIIEQKEDDKNINVKEAFNDRISQWKLELHTRLRSLGVPDNIIDDLPIVPAGTAASPDLPGYNFWLSNIKNEMIGLMTIEARCAYYMYSSDKLRRRDEVDKQEINNQPIHEQPWVLPSYLATASVIGLVAVAGAGAVGVGIGALIAGLTIKSGSAVGTMAMCKVAGGVIGGLIPVATSLAISSRKKTKED